MKKTPRKSHDPSLSVPPALGSPLNDKDNESKENFNLKLRIYYLEEQLRVKHFLTVFRFFSQKKIVLLRLNSQ